MNLHEHLEQAQKNKLDEIKEARKFVKTTNKALPFLPLLPDVSIYCYATSYDLNLEIPHDIPTVNFVIAELERMGWEPHHSFPETSTLKFRHPKVSFSLWVMVKLFMDGATCERVQIGEEEKITMQPIYEIVCKEGAKEEAMTS